MYDDGVNQSLLCVCVCCVCFVQAEDGIRDLVRSRGLGDVYKRQVSKAMCANSIGSILRSVPGFESLPASWFPIGLGAVSYTHLTLPTERSSVDLGGRRIIKKKNTDTSRNVLLYT